MAVTCRERVRPAARHTLFNSIACSLCPVIDRAVKFEAGHDNIASNNRVISSGLPSDGTKIVAQGVGLVNSATAWASASMYNNTMRDNLVGCACWKSSHAQAGYREDQFFPASPADYSTNSLFAAPQITFNMANNEYMVWAKQTVGRPCCFGPCVLVTPTFSEKLPGA
jgi:hypothetical protein